MSGVQINIDGEFIGAGVNNPKIYNDPRMTDGSLMLLSVGNSVGGFSDAVDAVQPNIAYRTAALMVGAGDATTLSPTLAIGPAGATGLGKEITANGALHIAAQQDATIINNRGYYLSIPSLIKTYLEENSDHSIYVSAIIDITRAAQNPVAVTYPVVVLGATTSQFVNLLTMRDEQLTKRIWNDYSDGYNAAGPQIISRAYSETTGTPTSMGAHMVPWGAVGTFGTIMSSNTDDIPSFALYALHIVDLTVAGITAADQAAKDAAYYAAAIATGGVIESDTLTAPATLIGV